MKTIIETKETLAGQRKVFHCELVSLIDQEAVVIFRIKKAMNFENLLFPAGTISFGYFWTERNYNIYHWVAPTGESLGQYYNIADRTSISSEEIYWRDLTVDLLFTPDGQYRVLDEDELPADIAPDLLLTINTARNQIINQQQTLIPEIEQRSAQLYQRI